LKIIALEAVMFIFYVSQLSITSYSVALPGYCKTRSEAAELRCAPCKTGSGAGVLRFVPTALNRLRKSNATQWRGAGVFCAVILDILLIVDNGGAKKHGVWIGEKFENMGLCFPNEERFLLP
jgi:hypothetical protein